jgi:hypothetical protein
MKFNHKTSIETKNLTSFYFDPKEELSVFQDTKYGYENVYL